MSPGPEDEVSQAEKRRIIREQAATMFQHAQSHANDEAGGRFASVNAAAVVLSEPAVRYPAASAHQRDPVPTEPPLGYCVDEMAPLEPSTVSSSFPVEDTGAPAGAAHTADNLPPSAESDDTGAPFSPTEGSK